MKSNNTALVKKLLREAMKEGMITCPKCGGHLESDAKVCSCGWKNVLIEGRYI